MNQDTKQIDENQIFELVILAGRLLLENGSEIFRVEETMKIIAKSFGIDDLDTFIMANGIFTSMPVAGQGTRTARIMHIPISPVHLGRVTAVNDVSRKVVAGIYTVETAMEELQKIKLIPYESNLLKTVFAGIGSGSFCFILGGTVSDSAVAFISGILLYLSLIIMGKARTPEMLSIAFGAAFVTFISIICFTFGIGTDLNHIIMGSVICLVPGVSFTTAIRNFFSGDYLSGTVRLVNALLVSVSISVGVAVVMLSWQMIQ